LDSLERQVDPPDEIIVVDSSDNDEIDKAVRHRNVVYEHANTRLYQPQARNLSLKIAKGDIVAFVDDDIVCTPEWLANVIQGYSYNNIAGVGGPVIRCDETFHPLERIIISDENRNFFKSYGDIRVTRAWIPSRPIRTELMMGGNMSFMKAKLKEVGGFDEQYGKGGAYREETDPQIAMVKRGNDFMYMPKAIVYHLQYSIGGIRSDDRTNYYYWCGKYHKYLADKYFPKWSSRLSWIIWSFDPPCLWICLVLAVLRRNRNFLKWIRGLWF
jgi:GT2 family glycosyltransferase